ncbi:MAG: hypothetical protein IH897_10140 [Planctomycetes bacterium]|nr:hypothetical protein [Planctomycetota bacterium]
MADLDGDTVPDLVTANISGGNVGVINLSDPPVRQGPALGPAGIAILLGLFGATIYRRQRDSASAA